MDNIEFEYLKSYRFKMTTCNDLTIFKQIGSYYTIIHDGKSYYLYHDSNLKENMDSSKIYKKSSNTYTFEGIITLYGDSHYGIVNVNGIGNVNKYKLFRRSNTIKQILDNER